MANLALVGRSTGQIGAELFLSRHTAVGHLKRSSPRPGCKLAPSWPGGWAARTADTAEHRGRWRRRRRTPHRAGFPRAAPAGSLAVMTELDLTPFLAAHQLMRHEYGWQSRDECSTSLNQPAAGLNGPGARQDLARPRPAEQSPGTEPTVGAGLSRQTASRSVVRGSDRTHADPPLWTAVTPDGRRQDTVHNRKFCVGRLRGD